MYVVMSSKTSITKSVMIYFFLCNVVEQLTKLQMYILYLGKAIDKRSQKAQKLQVS